MNSFIENVNYVANLDNKYGSSIEIYKNNMSLRTELHDIVFTLEYYNFTDKKLNTLKYSYNDISIDNFNSTLLNFKIQVELTGLFDCVVSFSYTNFIINNVASIDIKITSNSENIKTYGLNLNITKDLIELYSINGIVNDTLKILPYLASIDSDIFNGIITLSENIEDIQNAEENASIAITKANIATIKADEALSSANSASVSEAVSIEKSNISITKASEALTSANEALASKNAAKISETNASVSEGNTLTSANNAYISEANALASANSASGSATVATTKAGEAIVSSANALSSENSALVSKNSAIASASTSTIKANEALSSAGVATIQAGTATTKAGEASLSASNAIYSENKAEKWANELEDVAVDPGKYSAMHWAMKAYSIISVVDDQVTNTTNTYSSSKVQSMHDAQATAIANLASASATIGSSISQIIPEEPNGFSTLVWDNVTESSNSNIFELGSSSFIFKKNGIYNFFNSLDIYRTGSGAALIITFELYDADTGVTVMSAGLPIDMQSGTKQVIPFNVLLEINDVVATPKTIKVRMRSTSAAGSIELYTFNSILSLSSVSSTANVDTLDDALGALITGVLI